MLKQVLFITVLAACSTKLVFGGQVEKLPNDLTLLADASLVNLRIEGTHEVTEGLLARYSVIAEFDNGWEFDVTLDSSLWLDPGTHATIGVFGDLDAFEVDEDQTETIRAFYSFGSDSEMAMHDVTILDLSPAKFALDFDGIDQEVMVPASSSLDPEELTIEVWAYLDGAQDYSTRLVRKSNRSDPGGYFLAADQTGDRRMQLRVHNGGQEIVVKDVQSHVAYAGSWHHFAGVFSSEEAKLYIDGLEVNSISHNTGYRQGSPTSDLYIGSGTPGPDWREHFKGKIDEVRIWSIARTPCEIRHLMHRPLYGDEFGLVGYWRFDEGAGQMVHDSSRFGNHGTLGSNDDPGGEVSDATWVISEAGLSLPPLPQSGWSEAQPFTAANSTAAEWRLLMSPDMLTFYVMTERDGHFADTQIYRSERVSLSGPWSTPVPAPELNSGFHDNITYISPDDRKAYLSRHNNSLYSTIYETSRADASLPWANPSSVPELLGQSRAYLTVTSDGLHAMFNTWIGGKQNLWRTSRPDIASAWESPLEVSELNTSGSSGVPFLSADGRTVFFWSDRPGGSGSGDIYMATRPSLDASFAEPQPITEANTSYNERNPSLSPDGRTLFFRVNRPGGMGLEDIWYCTAINDLPDSPLPDLDNDCDVDSADLQLFSDCAAGPGVPMAEGCESRDFDNDEDGDQADFGILQRCYSGDEIADAQCAD